MTMPTRKIDFEETVEEGIALVGLISRFYTFLQHRGAEGSLGAGAWAVTQHPDLIEYWQGHATAARHPQGIYSLFTTCRDIINPVQSGLQNMVQSGQWQGFDPILAQAPSPDQLLRAIVRAKEDWAYIDAHPQIVIRH